MEEFDNLTRLIVHHLHAVPLSRWGRKHGTRMVRCEDGQVITDEDELYGALSPAINRALAGEEVP